MFGACDGELCPCGVPVGAGQTPDILDNAYVIVEYEGGARACLDLCMFAEGSRNEQEICVVGDQGKVCFCVFFFFSFLRFHCVQ